MKDFREATAIHGLPMGQNGEEGLYARVGGTFGAEGDVVSSIRVCADGNGISGHYDRVTVWAGEKMLMEAPLHNLEAVLYV